MVRKTLRIIIVSRLNLLGGEMLIREFFDDYCKYYPNRWSWSLSNDDGQNDLYLRTRARKSDHWYKNKDLLPDFYSIERDADQFGLCRVKWTDFFGLIWEGEKGTLAMVGAPDYNGSLYYYDENDEYSDDGYCISDEYDSYKNTPPNDIYTKVNWRSVNHWIDTANVCDVKYKYIVNNHLFKDTYIKLNYEDGESITVYDDYQKLISGMLGQGKKSLVNQILDGMNEHFIKLRDSDREEERNFFPGKTAEEMFLKNDEE